MACSWLLERFDRVPWLMRSGYLRPLPGLSMGSTDELRLRALGLSFVGCGFRGFTLRLHMSPEPHPGVARVELHRCRK